MRYSIRGYAKHRGVTEGAVRKAIRSCRIDIGNDGLIDPELADQQWIENTDLSKSHSKLKKQDGGIAEEEIAYEKVKIKHETLKAEIGTIEVKLLKGELIDRKKALDKVFTLARTERDIWVNWPSRVSATLAAELQVDEHELYTALEKSVRSELAKQANNYRSIHELPSSQESQ